MNRILAFIITVVICLSLFSFSAFAEESERETVYAPYAERELLYEMIYDEATGLYKQTQYGLEFGIKTQILKESITPVYTADFFDFAKTGELRLERENSPKTGNCYTAKLITDNGDFAANIFFSFDGEKITMGGGSLSDLFEGLYFEETETGFANVSLSYADHAERIRKDLGRDSFVSPYDVKLVRLAGVGFAFYIKDNGNEVFVPAGVMLKTAYKETVVTKPASSGKDISQNETLAGLVSAEDDALKDNLSLAGKDIVYSVSDLKVIADKELEKYNDRHQRKEEWEREHPGELFLYITGENSNAVYECSYMENIIDVASYLGIDMSGSSEDVERLRESYGKKTFPWLPVVIASAAVLAAVTVFIVIKKRTASKKA